MVGEFRSLDVYKVVVRGGSAFSLSSRWTEGVGCGGASLQRKVPVVKQRARVQCRHTQKDSPMIRFVSFARALPPYGSHSVI